MRVVADTNLLVRLAVADDVGQKDIAARIVKDAEAVIVGNVVLCEMVWVLRAKYRFSKEATLRAVETLYRIENVVVNMAAVEAGLEAMRAGADFADGVINFEGRMAGGEVFVSFDRRAVVALLKIGQTAKSLAQAAV